MVIHWDQRKTTIYVLLDTGCTTPLISNTFVDKTNVPCLRHEHGVVIRNFSGDIVQGAGNRYTKPMLLQHRKHYTREIFEVAPLEPGVDVFLPFWWISKHTPQGAWDSSELRFSTSQCLTNCTKTAVTEFPLHLDETILQDPEARLIGYVSAVELTRDDPLEQVPGEFRQFLPIMGKEAAEALPDHAPYDMRIELKGGENPPWGPIYPLSEHELETLREWLKEMLRTGKIRRSTSSAGSPILFVPKPNGRGLRLCVDYRGINRVTIPNRYPLPLMQELQDRIQGAQWFTKMDLKNGFHLIRIREGDEWKTAFRTRYGLYEFLVMPFGLMNAPATFQDMMNHIFRDIIDLGLLVYMDDLLIYAKTTEEHDNIVREVLKRLQSNKLAVSPEKCVWRQQEVEFLGYLVGREGIKMSHEKVEALLEWKSPSSLTEVQSFLGFANFYRRFIRNYSQIARPLTELTKSSAKDWKWTTEAELAFHELKARFTSAPILAHFNPQKPVIVETDASDFALGAVLSQRDNENLLHPVAFHSRKFTPAEINYEIHDKELLAIVDAFKHWRRYCEGAIHQIHVFSDHQNLEYFTTTKVLNRRQARWAQELAGIDFKIFFRPGSQNGKPDALSRRSEYRPMKGGSEDQPITTILHPSHFSGRISTAGPGTIYVSSAAQLVSTPVRKWNEDFASLVREAGKKDPKYRKALEDLEKEAASAGPMPNGSLNAEEEAVLPCEEQRPGRTAGEVILGILEGLLYRKGLLWVPDDKDLILKILESEHDTKVAGHMGQDKTIELIRRNFWWPRMDERIIDFVRSCTECQKNKAARHQPYGLLHPLELPYAPWQSIAMDFITDLPLSDGCDQLWVIIDRFTKMAHFLPLLKDGKTANDLAKIFAREVWRHHGLPSDIVSDRDSRFTSEVWKEFLRLSDIRPRMSTAFHPQTDGQTERLNQTIEAYLRSFVNHEQDDWAGLLPMAEFAYNNSVTMATGLSPFYANYGFHPAATNPAAAHLLNPASKVYAHWMHAVHEKTRESLEEAQERMRRYSDPKRKDNPAYQVGDLVMLNGRNIQTRRPSRKLDHKNHGPFQIERIVSPLAVKLTLPRKWKIHDVFHVSLVEPYRTGNQRLPPNPAKVLREADDIEQSEEYDVEEVMSSTKKGRRILYLVKWLDYPNRKDWTEEPFDNFSAGGLDKLREFHRKNPTAPRDYRLTDI
jgi:transposase InsO family protein